MQEREGGEEEMRKATRTQQTCGSMIFFFFFFGFLISGEGGGGCDSCHLPLAAPQASPPVGPLPLVSPPHLEKGGGARVSSASVLS